LKIPLLTGSDFFVIEMPKDGFNGSGITYKADMFIKNTFSVPTSWSFLIIYEPSWYEAGYF
jgi:hypothetical protein